MNHQPKPLSELTAEELSDYEADARNCMNSPGFQYLLSMVKEQFHQELLNAEVGSLTASSAHASMKALDRFVQHFSILSNEKTMRAKNGRYR